MNLTRTALHMVVRTAMLLHSLVYKRVFLASFKNYLNKVSQNKITH